MLSVAFSLLQGQDEAITASQDPSVRSSCQADLQNRALMFAKQNCKPV
jgi:hypothetical protein